MRFSSLLLTFALAAAPFTLAHAAPKSAKVEAPSFADTPAHFELVKPEANYIKRVEMIPMRDGVKLYT
ncbi:MAG: glutaryl-7-ACA acylase, partial [Pseudomonadota bacterium]|nr:glutaryl-7-ACA acylase [Pseudomonadota bacterium]